MTLWDSAKPVANMAVKRPRFRFARQPRVILVTIIVLASTILYCIPMVPAADSFDVYFGQIWQDRFSLSSTAIYPVEFFGSVMPVPCHSHNDYWRRTPLFAALGSGCVSIEADVWLEDGDLLVGHTRHTLRGNATLRNMYIDPLARILRVINTPRSSSHATPVEPLGVFYNDPAQTLTLLVDFKTPSAETLPVLLAQLQPLRDAGWLTHWNGTERITRPITVVASGSVDFDALVANRTYRDVFYDAPLEALEDDSDGHLSPDDDGRPETLYDFKYNPSNSYFASVSLSKAVGPVLFSKLSPAQLQKVKRQIASARERHLIPRYWGTPRWPRGLRDAIWAELVQEETGLLNVDDLRAMRKGNWGMWS